METLYACTLRINNLPDNESYRKYRYIVLNPVDGEIWYYGADNNYDRAIEVAKHIGGFVIVNDIVENN